MVSCTTTVITHSSLTAFQAPAVSLNARQMPGRWPSATDPVLGVTDVMTLAVMVTGTAAGSGERPPCGPRPLPAVTPMSDAAPRRQGAAAVRRSDRRRSGRPPRHNNQSCVALPLVFSVPIPTQIGGSFARTPPAPTTLCYLSRHYGYGTPQCRAPVAGRPRPGRAAALNELSAPLLTIDDVPHRGICGRSP